LAALIGAVVISRQDPPAPQTEKAGG